MQGKGSLQDTQYLKGVIGKPSTGGASAKSVKSVKSGKKASAILDTEASAKANIKYPAAVANNVPAKSSAKVKKFVK